MEATVDSYAPEGSPIFDNLDFDLVVKVISHTALSPFFVFFIPVFYFFQGVELTSPIIIGSAGYCVAISLFWFVKWYSRLYRNQGSLLFAPPRFDWSDQIVVVTGGASGVGELLANTLAVRNVTVVVLDVKPIQTENYNIQFYKCDVSNYEEVQAVSKKVIEEIGDPTIIINNAGVAQGKTVLDLSAKDVQQTFGVNTLAHFWVLKAFLPGLLKAGTGHIITMSSVMAFGGAARMTDYCASKAALNLLHESLRYELDNVYKCPEIRTTLVCSGHLQTAMFSHAKFPVSFLHKFFLPSLQPIVIVKKVIAAIDEQHGQNIFLPFYVNFMPFLQTFPSFLRDFAQWVSGADRALDSFVKVTGRREDEPNYYNEKTL